MAYIKTFNPILERMIQESINHAVDPLVQTMRAIGLNNGRELKYYLAPPAGDKITVPEILKFMQMQVDTMQTNTYPHDYNVGYRDAIEAIYLYIKKRIEEDSKKKKEVDANCC